MYINERYFGLEQVNQCDGFHLLIKMNLYNDSIM